MGLQSQAKSFAVKVKRFLDLSPFSIPFLCSPGLLNLTNDCILMPSTYKIDFYSGALVLVDLVSGTIFSYIFTYLFFFFYMCQLRCLLPRKASWFYADQGNFSQLPTATVYPRLYFVTFLANLCLHAVWFFIVFQN